MKIGDTKFIATIRTKEDEMQVDAQASEFFGMVLTVSETDINTARPTKHISLGFESKAMAEEFLKTHQ